MNKVCHYTSTYPAKHIYLHTEFLNCTSRKVSLRKCPVSVVTMCSTDLSYRFFFPKWSSICYDCINPLFYQIFKSFVHIFVKIFYIKQAQPCVCDTPILRTELCYWSATYMHVNTATVSMPAVHITKLRNPMQHGPCWEAYSHILVKKFPALYGSPAFINVMPCSQQPATGPSHSCGWNLSSPLPHASFVSLTHNWR
jgi:hypothetical protein